MKVETAISINGNICKHIETVGDLFIYEKIEEPFSDTKTLYFANKEGDVWREMTIEANAMEGECVQFEEIKFRVV